MYMCMCLLQGSSCPAGTYADDLRKYPSASLASPSDPRAAPGQQTVLGSAYGNGIYEVSWSSEWWWRPIHVFNGLTATSDAGGNWAPYQYDASGSYVGSATAVPGYNGDWINLKLPEYIHLAYIYVYLRYTSRRPRDYRVYGTNGTNWDQLISESNAAYNFSGNVLHISVPAAGIGKKYNQFMFAVSKLVDDPMDGCLNFAELEFYGSTTCSLCPSGKYSSAVGATSSEACVQCPAANQTYAGSFSAIGATACTQCSQGKYAPSAGMTTCMNVSRFNFIVITQICRKSVPGHLHEACLSPKTSSQSPVVCRPMVLLVL